MCLGGLLRWLTVLLWVPFALCAATCSGGGAGGYNCGGATGTNGGGNGGGYGATQGVKVSNGAHANGAGGTKANTNGGCGGGGGSGTTGLLQNGAALTNANSRSAVATGDPHYKSGVGACLPASLDRATALDRRMPRVLRVHPARCSTWPRPGGRGVPLPARRAIRATLAVPRHLCGGSP